MALLHDTQTRHLLEQRIRALTPTSRATWGKMSVDQMLWHVNQALGLSLGTVTVGPGSPPIPPRILKFLVLKFPWGKGGPTHPDFIAKQQYDFAAEQARTLQLIAAAVAKPMDDDWLRHPAFGKMTGREVSTLMAKHLNHHLTQFGV